MPVQENKMPRRYICELKHQEPVAQVFLAGEKILRPNRNGNLYLQVALCDRSGSIPAMIWNADQTLYQSFNAGDYVHVEGVAQLYQGEMQIIAKRLRKVEAAEVDEADFRPVSSADVERLLNRLADMLRSMSDLHLQSLAECFLMDEPLMAKLSMAPAGTKHHHAYLGGLLQHTVSLMELALRVAELYPQLDRDLLLMGAFLHDLGKIEELTFAHGLGYSDEGQLIGHLVQGVELLNRKLAEVEKLVGELPPQDTVARLKHMLLSHHGEYAFGSPKLPMTLEALALAQLDCLDAKLHAFEHLMRHDPNTESPWTIYHAGLERKLYKGKPGKTG